MVVGPVDSGKSTLSKVLTAYACRIGRTPIMIDVDVGQGEISVPGTVAAMPTHMKCLDVVVRAETMPHRVSSQPHCIRCKTLVIIRL